jgi:threonine synthase
LSTAGPTSTLATEPILGVSALSCRECGRAFEVGPLYYCDVCFGPLQADYDYEAIASSISHDAISAGPASVWRYAQLLPAPRPEERVDIGAGFTPLRPAPRLAAELGLKRLWIKNDTFNPTHSFKDRVVTVALSAARHFGFDTVGCASTGNLANSVAAHAAAMGLRSIVFIPAGLERGKVLSTAVFGGEIVEIDGTYDDVNRVCSELAGSKPWAFVNVNLRTFYAEGSKTLGFEIAEQLGWRSPDVIVGPVASGAMLTKVARGLSELERVGMITSKNTRIFGAQAEGCSPVARAYAEGADEVTPVRPDSVAKSLAIGDPADGRYLLAEVRRSSGAMAAVPEESVAEAIRLLARTEGLFTEAAGGVTVAALERLTREGAIAPDEETVVLITGLGLKTLEVLGPQASRAPVAPNIAVVEEALKEGSK